MSRKHSMTVRRRAQGHDVRFCGVQLLPLVGANDAHPHSAVKTKDELVRLFQRPGETSHGGVCLQELVADGLFLSPLQSELVDKDDVVALCDSELGRVWRKGHARDHVVFRALCICRLGREFVLFLRRAHQRDAQHGPRSRQPIACCWGTNTAPCVQCGHSAAATSGALAALCQARSTHKPGFAYSS
eukprot:34671_4